MNSPKKLPPSKPNEPLPYYRWYWRDWRGSFAVQSMSALERGIYRELLDEQWRLGALENDIAWLARRARCTPDEMAVAWLTLSECFQEVEGSGGELVRNERLESERSEADARRVKARISGAQGGKAKANAKQSLANAKQSPSERRIAVAGAEQSSSSSTAPSALALVASARAECPFGCGGVDGNHSAACSRKRLSAEEAAS
jgi:uncharacterized protein YdaU (DUF1376 family)